MWKSPKGSSQERKVCSLRCFFQCFPKLYSPSPSLPTLSLPPSPFTAWSPSQQSLHPLHLRPTAARFSLLSSALAACQRLCYGRTRHWGLKLSTDVDEDKGEVEHKARVMMGVVVVAVEWWGELQQFVSWKVNTHYYLRSHQQPRGVKWLGTQHSVIERRCCWRTFYTVLTRFLSVKYVWSFLDFSPAVLTNHWWFCFFQPLSGCLVESVEMWCFSSIFPWVGGSPGDYLHREG